MPRFIGKLLALPLLVVLAGLLGASMIRFAPGFDIDEREMDPRLTDATREQLRRERAGERDILRYYANYLAAAARGDLGQSRTLGMPVAQLVRERLPVTARLACAGLLIAWLWGGALALISIVKPGGWADAVAGAAGGMFLSIPSALVAVAFLHLDAWLPLAVGLVLFPRIYAYLRNTLGKVAAMPHVLLARARGAGPLEILWRHVLPVAMPELAALAGISVSLALGAAVPVEVLCDLPGIGQLAWQAALARDLPVLVGLTWIAAVITLVSNTAASCASRRAE